VGDVETFVIRVWTAATAEPGEERESLHGLAEHVGGGSETVFSNTDQLLAFLHTRTEPRDTRSRPAAERREHATPHDESTEEMP
jgi:hypothetical protein